MPASTPNLSSSPEAATRIRSWLEARCDEMVELLVRLVEAESPTTEPSTHREVCSILTGELQALGFEVARIPGNEVGDHLLALGSPQPGPGQLLLGHFDTVWPLGTLDSMPAKIEDGRLHGPGAYDMKAGLVQGLFALQAIGAAGLTPPLPVTAFLNADEEIGSPDSRRKLDELSRESERAFVLEPSAGARGNLKTARKGVGGFEVRIHGKASHAGLAPGEGASAIVEASHQIQRLFALNDPERGTTVNVGTIDGGIGANVVAPEVVLEIDVRVTSAEDMAAVEAGIRALEPQTEGVSLDVQGGFRRPPLERTERNRALWRQAVDAAQAVGIELDEALVGGGSDGNLASVHTATLDGLGAVGDGAHAVFEHVVIERMPERAALLAMLLLAPPEGVR
ncbi:MAG: M20 family metallopeptidase [Solirubrobacterales bacterium]